MPQRARCGLQPARVSNLVELEAAAEILFSAGLHGAGSQVLSRAVEERRSMISVLRESLSASDSLLRIAASVSAAAAIFVS